MLLGEKEKYLQIYILRAFDSYLQKYKLHQLVNFHLPLVNQMQNGSLGTTFGFLYPWFNLSVLSAWVFRELIRILFEVRLTMDYCITFFESYCVTYIDVINTAILNFFVLFLTASIFVYTPNAARHYVMRPPSKEKSLYYKRETNASFSDFACRRLEK